MKLHLQVLLLAAISSVVVTAAEYQSQKTAVPLSVFEERYAIDYPEQLLEAGTDYAYGGGGGNVYFIQYTFDDGVTHLVRVPQSHEGVELTRLVGRRVQITTSFPLTFTHGSILFDPRKEYPVLEETESRLLVAVPGEIEPIEVDTNRFRLKRQLVFQKEPTLRAPETEAGKTGLNAYLESHPPLEELPVLKNDVDGICLVEAAESSGTGFLFGMGGRVYCITNHHVLGDGSNLKLVTADDRRFTPVHFEIAADRDLARILLKEAPACFQSFGEAKMQETIHTLGNSGGEGVVTFDEGKVIGFAPTVIELNSDFIKGNSGSPVLNEANEVIGVATYLVAADEGEDNWVTEKTRFVKARRFATRFTEDIEWVAMDSKSMRSGHQAFEGHFVYIDEMIKLLWTFAPKPDAQMVESSCTNLNLRSWIRQTNMMNKNFGAQEQAIRYTTQVQYDVGIEMLAADRLAGYNLQIQRLNLLTKRQLMQLQRDARRLPEVGCYPEQIKELETQYKILIDGLELTSRYLAESTPF